MSVARTGKWNPGGGKWLDVAVAIGIASYTRPTPASIPLITFSPNFDWIRIYCSDETLQYRQSSEPSDNGPLYTVEIKGFSPDDNFAKAATIDALLYYEKLLVRFTDRNGLVRIAGTKNQPLTFSYELDTDKTTTGQRGYSLNFSGESTQRGAYA
jgi:hypothetical protein